MPPLLTSTDRECTCWKDIYGEKNYKRNLIQMLTKSRQSLLVKVLVSCSQLTKLAVTIKWSAFYITKCYCLKLGISFVFFFFRNPLNRFVTKNIMTGYDNIKKSTKYVETTTSRFTYAEIKQASKLKNDVKLYYRHD